MRVALFTTAFTDKKRLKNLARSHLKEAVRRGKVAGLLLPNSIVRPLMTGFSLERRFPYGLGLLSSMLKRNGHTVELFDRFVDEDDWPEDVARFDFVGLHTTTPCFSDALQIVQRLELEGFQGKIALGGPHVSLYPETAPPRVNYVVKGEAEYVICDLVEGKYPDGAILECARINNLDDLPRVDYSLFFERARGYDLSVPFFSERPVFNLSTGRSCPYRCTFCATRRIWGTLWRSPSPEKIVDEIEFLKTDFQVGGVYFREDLFTTNKDRVMKICELLSQRDLRLPWACETRAEQACDVDMVNAMAKSGCKGFYIGAESGSQRMLDIYNKEATVEHTIRACEIAKKNHIKVAMSVIVGDDEARMSDRIDTWKMVRKTQPEILQCSVYDGVHTSEGHNSRFPAYPDREVVRTDYGLGTWKGQKDRINMLSV